MARGDHRYARKSTQHTRLHTMTDVLDHSATAHRLFYSDGSGNVQELAHGTSGQVLTSGGASTAPSWVAVADEIPAEVTLTWAAGVTTMTGQDDLAAAQTLWTADADGAFSLYYDGTLQLQNHASGLNLLDTTGSANTDLTFLDSVSATIGILHFGTTGARDRVKSFTHGRSFGIVGEDAGGVEKLMAEFNPDTSADLYYDGQAVPSLLTSADGIDIQTDGTASANPAALFFNNTTRTGFIQFGTAAGQMRLNSEVHGAEWTLNGEDAGGTSRALIAADPDGALKLYYAGTKVFESHANGFHIYNASTPGTETYLGFHDDAGTREGFLQMGTTAMQWRSEVHGLVLEIEGEDAGGTTRLLFDGDPDGASRLYYAGTAHLATDSNGIDVIGTLCDLTPSGNSTSRFRTWNTTGGGAAFTVAATTGQFSIATLNTSGAATGNHMRATLSGSVELFYNGGVSLETHDTGIYLNNSTSVGLFEGTGTPESAVTAGIGSIYLRRDGGAGTSIYVKESGTGNTGWVAK